MKMEMIWRLSMVECACFGGLAVQKEVSTGCLGVGAERCGSRGRVAKATARACVIGLFSSQIFF